MSSNDCQAPIMMHIDELSLAASCPSITNCPQGDSYSLRAQTISRDEREAGVVQKRTAALWPSDRGFHGKCWECLQKAEGTRKEQLRSRSQPCNKNHKATYANYLFSCFIQNHLLPFPSFTLALSSFIGWLIKSGYFCSI